MTPARNHERLLIPVSPEFAEQLSADWSEPVRVKLESQEDGTPMFVAQRYDVLSAELSSPAAVDRYRLRQEHEADVVAFVLAGLDVGSLAELHRLVEAGRASEVAA